MRVFIFILVLFSLDSCGHKQEHSPKVDDDIPKKDLNYEKPLQSNLNNDSIEFKAWIDLALSNLKDGKAELSRNQFDSAYKYGLSEDLYEYSIGYTYYWENEYLRAVLFMEKAIELNPNIAKYHIRLAECYYSIKEDKGLVLKTLRKGILLGGEMPANIPSSYFDKVELRSIGKKA